MKKKIKKTKRPKGKLGKTFDKKTHKVMSEWKAGTLHSGSDKGPLVTSQAQAIAIGLSEARKKVAQLRKG